MHTGSSGSQKRLLVVGDSAVGKSLFVSTLMRECGCDSTAAASELSGGQLMSTIGFRCDAIVLSMGPEVNGGTRRVIEFVDVGGNRGFEAVSRLPCYHLSIDGVLFVYSREHRQSAVSLSVWYRELMEAGVLGGEGVGKPFLIIETVLRESGDDKPSGLMTKQGHPSGLVRSIRSRCNSALERSKTLQNVVRAVRRTVFFIVASVQRAIVLIMTVVLFGTSHSGVQWSPPSATKVLDELHGDPQCRGEIRGYPLFPARRGDVENEALGDFLYFVSRL
jgi:hypothetical protein